MAADGGALNNEMNADRTMESNDEQRENASFSSTMSNNVGVLLDRLTLNSTSNN